MATHAATRLERVVHATLLTGILLSAALLASGLALALHSGEPRGDGPPPPLREILLGGLRGDGVDLLELGLLVMMATPMARVVVLALGWSLEGRRRYALTALGVLCLLILSLTLGTG